MLMAYHHPDDGLKFLPSPEAIYVACSHCEHPVDITRRVLVEMRELADQVGVLLSQKTAPEHVLAGIENFREHVAEQLEDEAERARWVRLLTGAAYESEGNARITARQPFSPHTKRGRTRP